MIIGVDLGGTNIRAGLVRDDKILELNCTLLYDKDSLESTLLQILSAISPLMRSGIRGIGIGVPSVVDIEQGIVYNVVNIPSWKRVELKSVLEKEFKVPVAVNNDVNCFALGEYVYGGGKAFSSLVALALGTGLGSGIVLNGKLYSGSNGGAGEVGCLPYLDSNFEAYTSSMFFEQNFASTALDMHRIALDGNASAIDAWKMYGLHMGNVIKAVLYTYDPQAIILGGSISKAFPLFEAAMWEALDDFLFPESLKRLRLYPSSLENAAIYGAAALFSGQTAPNN